MKKRDKTRFQHYVYAICSMCVEHLLIREIYTKHAFNIQYIDSNLVAVTPSAMSPNNLALAFGFHIIYFAFEINNDKNATQIHFLSLSMLSFGICNNGKAIRGMKLFSSASL